jgi:hypothetical protein
MMIIYHDNDDYFNDDANDNDNQALHCKVLNNDIQGSSMKSLNFFHDLVTFFFDHVSGNFNL